MNDFSWDNSHKSGKGEDKQIWKTIIQFSNGDLLDCSLFVGALQKTEWVLNDNTLEMEERFELKLIQNGPLKNLTYLFPSEEAREEFLEDLKTKFIEKGIDLLI